jgi:hypothetical protein
VVGSGDSGQLMWWAAVMARFMLDKIVHPFPVRTEEIA